MNSLPAKPFSLSKIRYLLAALVVGCALSLPAAAQIKPQSSTPTASQTKAATTPGGRALTAGRDYLVLAHPMPAPDDRLEVVYFFWYNSPTSAKVDPLMREWVATKASPLIKFRPLPAVLENSWGYGARVYFALIQLGKEDVVGPKLFRALSDEIVDYKSPKSMSDWLRDQGVSIGAMSKAINDPRVIAQTSWMPSMMRPYGVERVPTVVIDGQFLFVASPDEDPEAFVSRIGFASDVLTQRKLQEIAKRRQSTKAGS